MGKQRSGTLNRKETSLASPSKWGAEAGFELSDPKAGDTVLTSSDTNTNTHTRTYTHMHTRTSQTKPQGWPRAEAAGHRAVPLPPT